MRGGITMRTVDSIERQVEKIERAIDITNQKPERTIIIFEEGNAEEEKLPPNIEDWLIYKQRPKKQTIGRSNAQLIILMVSDEVTARKKQLATA